MLGYSSGAVSAVEPGGRKWGPSSAAAWTPHLGRDRDRNYNHLGPRSPVRQWDTGAAPLPDPTSISGATTASVMGDMTA